MKPIEYKPVVAHCVPVWLPVTMSWVYNQLKYAKQFSGVVLASDVQNLDQFPWEPVYAPISKRQRLFFRAQRKLRIRSYPSIFDSGIRRHRASILHSHFGDCGWQNIGIAKKHGLRHVVTFYGYDVNMLPSQQPVWRQRYAELFQSADLFLCEGPYMASCLVELGCPAEKVKVQRLGVEVDKIQFKPRKIGSDGVIKILIAGTFREKKGIPYALEAVGMLRQKYSNVSVTVIGDSTGLEREEREKTKILETIKQYGLESVVRFLGFQSHDCLMKEAYLHDVFLSPSVTSSDGDTEGGAPVTIIEMAASGMPVVSTKHCDIPFVLGATNRARLIGERNSRAACDELSSLLDLPSHELDQMLLENRGFVTTELDVARCSLQTENYYLSLLNNLI